MWLHNFIIHCGTVVIFITLAVSIYYYHREKPAYFRDIFIFILLGILLSSNSILLREKWGFIRKAPYLIQELLLLGQYILLVLFFLKILINSSFIKKIKTIFIFSLLVNILLWFLSFYKNIDIKPSSISTLFLLSYCAFYVRDIMTNKPTLILVKSSSFWIVMGIFFYSCISFPIVTMIKFIPRNSEYINLRSELFSVINMSLIILYSFIIKGYLCLRHPLSSL